MSHNTVIDGRYLGACRNCGMTIRSDNLRAWVHSEGSYWGKGRCGEESGQPYGLDATPISFAYDNFYNTWVSTE